MELLYSAASDHRCFLQCFLWRLTSKYATFSNYGAYPCSGLFHCGMSLQKQANRCGTVVKCCAREREVPGMISRQGQWIEVRKDIHLIKCYTSSDESLRWGHCLSPDKMRKETNAIHPYFQYTPGTRLLGTTAGVISDLNLTLLVIHEAS